MVKLIQETKSTLELSEEELSVLYLAVVSLKRLDVLSEEESETLLHLERILDEVV